MSISEGGSDVGISLRLIGVLGTLSKGSGRGAGSGELISRCDSGFSEGARADLGYEALQQV